jgi:tRNA methyltransferase complex GCD14 subunit
MTHCILSLLLSFTLLLQSIIIFRLNLKPGDVVIESGTGSGAMSTAILRTIAPHGHLHTFEFNKLRATVAADEFVNNGLSSVVTVKHSDVCVEGFGAALNGKADAVRVLYTTYTKCYSSSTNTSSYVTVLAVTPDSAVPKLCKIFALLYVCSSNSSSMVHVRMHDSCIARSSEPLLEAH